MSGGKTMFTKTPPKPPSPPEEISAFLGKETLFEGKMTFQGVFRLDGRFEGEIFESGTLIVGESAHIKGKIGVKMIIINGYVEGELHAVERIEIHSTGKFSGTLITPSLIINDGGILNGHCKMESGVATEEELHPAALNTDHTLSIS
ncbi:MAG: polymer-forming cytoskeletal protein [Deltaproteobacteria bacterium]|nr:polymer-forming cytoskeletal protein [Deltaproteobacteria bacterium]MBM4323173.1 polymer-forming cytoskeletal protein [Deltaproteobacteria bacterium]